MQLCVGFLHKAGELCQEQVFHHEACYELFHHHKTFQDQILFIRNHRPFTKESGRFYEQAIRMERITIGRFLYLLLTSDSAHLHTSAQAPQSDFVRDLEFLTGTYLGEITHAHGILPRDHALFQSPSYSIHNLRDNFRDESCVDTTRIPMRPLSQQSVQSVVEQPKGWLCVDNHNVHTWAGNAAEGQSLTLDQRPSVELEPDDAQREEWRTGPYSKRHKLGSWIGGLTNTQMLKPLLEKWLLPLPARRGRGSSPLVPSLPLGLASLTVSQMLSHLIAHGCLDMSENLDLTLFTGYTVSNDGSSLIRSGKLIDGTKVTVIVPKDHAKPITDISGQCPKNLEALTRDIRTWSRYRFGMVLPRICYGNLTEYLLSLGLPTVGSHPLYTQICNGLAYLHQLDIVHGDLKADNVLLSDDGTLMLTLQSVQSIQDTRWYHSGRKWLAPELRNGFGWDCSKEADVYALGMTILEVITMSPPIKVPGLFGTEYFIDVNMEIPVRPELIPISCDGNKLWDLLVTCWSHQPEARPRAATVANVMETITRKGMWCADVGNPTVLSTSRV